MDTVKKYQVAQSLIDAVAFYVGNYALDSYLKEPHVKLDKAVIFGLVDLLIRNGQITFARDKLPEIKSQVFKNNAYIALVSFAASTAYDMVRGGHSLSNSVKKNLIYNAIGFGSNSILDKFVLNKEWQ